MTRATAPSASTVRQTRSVLGSGSRATARSGRGCRPGAWWSARRSFRKLLVSYFAGLFRSVRFGVEEAHGKGAALQINRLVEAGAATVDPTTGKYRVDLGKIEAAIAELVRDICTIQHRGDKPAAEALLARYGKVDPATQRALDGLTGIPVDIRPYYPAAGEILPK